MLFRQGLLAPRFLGPAASRADLWPLGREGLLLAPVRPGTFAGAPSASGMLPGSAQRRQWARSRMSGFAHGGDPLWRSLAAIGSSASEKNCRKSGQASIDPLRKVKKSADGLPEEGSTAAHINAKRSLQRTALGASASI